MVTADRSGSLPPRGEFVVRNAYVVTVDTKLGDIPRGDVHVRNGAIIAVGPNLTAPGADEASMAATESHCPGFVETHFHWWAASPGIVADRSLRLFPGHEPAGPVMTPEDAYHSARLGIAEAINSGLTTIHDWSHNIINGAYADADLRALRDTGIRALSPTATAETCSNDRKRPRRFRRYRSGQARMVRPSNDGLTTMGFASRGAGDTPPEVYVKEWEYARVADLSRSTLAASLGNQTLPAHRNAVQGSTAWSRRPAHSHLGAAGSKNGT